jgi:DNA-binding NarL/FixJ family response regulator
MAVRTTIRETRNGSGNGNGSGALTGGVVLLDEHPIWLDALEQILRSSGVRVIGKATSPEAAVQMVVTERPAALVASIELPTSEMDWVECLRRARDRAPGLKIVAVSMHDDAFHLSTALAAGADAYVAKTATAPEVAQTVRDCLEHANGTKRPARARALEEAAQPALTARELEILRLVARGYTNVQIAERLWVTKWTVKFHLVNAYRKLGVSNRTQAARYVFDHGLAHPLDRSA